MFKKNKNASSLFWVLEICILVKKTTENHKSVDAGARTVENLVPFLPNFDPHFPNTRKAQKRY